MHSTCLISILNICSHKPLDCLNFSYWAFVHTNLQIVSFSYWAFVHTNLQIMPFSYLEHLFTRAFNLYYQSISRPYNIGVRVWGVRWRSQVTQSFWATKQKSLHASESNGSVRTCLLFPRLRIQRKPKKQQQIQTVVKEENSGTYVTKRHQRSLSSKTNKETRCKEPALFNANNCHLRYIKVPLNDLQEKHERQ